DGVARTLRDAGDKIDSPPGIELDRYVSRAAEGVERASAYLRERQLRDVMRDVEGYARREPALFFGGAFALGLLASRFLKSSSPSARSNRLQPAGQWSPPRGQNGERARMAQSSTQARPGVESASSQHRAQPSVSSVGDEASTRSAERSGRPAAGGEARKNATGQGASPETSAGQNAARGAPGGTPGAAGDKPSSKA
ncbi:MAG: hypothetical protein JOZ69_24820, partial [Myxococcales bacterium]|nr:hypothetical protein [Myxococcales bacterium]